MYAALRLVMAMLIVFSVVVPTAARPVEAAATSSFAVDVNQKQMKFNTPTACTSGKNPSVVGATWNVNDQCFYNNVFTWKDASNVSHQVDAVITITRIDAKAAINVFDLPDSTYDGRFNPVIYTKSTNPAWTGYEGANFNIQFYNHSSTISLATIGQAEKAELMNFFMTVIDIDGNSASLTEYVEISGFQSYQVDKNTLLQTEKPSGGRVRFRGISTNVAGLGFQSNDSVIAYYSEPIQSIDVVGGNTGALGAAGDASQRQFSYDFGASGGVTNSRFDNPVTHPTVTVAIDDSGAGRLYPNAGNSQLTAVPVSGTATIGSGRSVTLTFKNNSGTTVGTKTAAVAADGTYSTTVDATSWGRPASISVTVTGSNAAGVAADPETATVPMNRIPAATAQSVTTAEDTAKQITLAGTDTDSDALTYEISSAPQHGTLSAISGNKVTYTPDADYNGSDTFSFKTKDGFESSAAAQVSVTVTAVNDVPTADPKQLDTPKNTAKIITLSGSDVDGDSLTYAIQTSPQHGTLGPVNGTQVTYAPQVGYVGTDSFTYIAKDGKGGNSAPATVDLTITAVNSAPTADGQQVTTNEDTQVTITLTGTDADGDTLTYLIQNSTQHGTLGSVNGSQVTYRPSANFSGTDSFTFIANDGTENSQPATVVITVAPVNDTPIAQPLQTVTNEDMPVVLTLAGTDYDGDSLTYEIIDQPLHGTLSAINGMQLTYTPDPNYSGMDSFTYVAKDGQGGISAPATYDVTVIPIEDPPVASPQHLTTDEDVPVAVTLSGSDPDGDSLTYTIVSDPTNGTLSTLNGAVVTYTPNSGFSGTDSFTFTVDDGHGNVSAPATVSLTISSVNHAPTAAPQLVTTDEDTPVAITLAGIDPDGDSLTYTIIDGPVNGSLGALNGSDVTYTPATGYIGTDSFTFTVRDGAGLASAPETVNITVNHVNHSPAATGQQVTTNENSAAAITLAGTDPDGDTLTYEIVTAPQHGTVSAVIGNAVTYTPNADYAGADSFTFVVHDGNGGTSSAETVNITVMAVNHAPAVTGQQVVTEEDKAAVITLAGTDPDGDTLTYEIVDQPAHGTVSVNGNQVTYTPDPGYEGTDSFTFVAKDGNGGTSTAATVDITVNHVNHAPTAAAQQVTTDEDVAAVITLAGTDPDGDTLTYEIIDQPAHGTLSVVNGNQVTYTPDPGYEGTDSFTFVAKDGNGGTSTEATVGITVNHVNHAPTATGQQVTTDEDVAAVITLAGADPDGDTLTYEIIDQPAHGTLSVVNGNQVTYTPDPGYEGADSFTFVTKDGNGGTSTAATVDITVNHVNHAPTAAAQQVTTDEDVAAVITLAGTDPDGDTLTYEIIDQPAHGTVSVNGNQVTYTPDPGYEGADSFTFVTKDGNGGTSTAATVDITVNHVNHAPVANGQQVTTDEEIPVPITLTGSDPEANQLNFIIVNGPAHGQLTGTGSGLTYTPNNGYTGTDSFTFKVNDSDLDSAPAVVSIQVQPLEPLDGWVGSRAQGETSPYVIVTPGSPLKLSAVSALSAKRVVATVKGVQVELQLMNAATAEADGKKVWSNAQYRLSNTIAAGDYKATFVAYDEAGHVTQQEKTERQLEDNAYHVRTHINLSGTITDQETGQPISGAYVTLYDLTGTIKLGGPITTNANGKYDFGTIRTGEYLIVVKADGYGTRSNMIQAMPSDLTSTEIVRDYELVRFNLGLSASPSAIVGDGVTTSTLTSVLTDKDGKPIAGVEVEFSAPRGSFVDGTPGIHLTQKDITNAQGVAKVLYRSDKIEGILSQTIPVTAKVDDPEHHLFAIEQVIVTFQPASITGVVTSNTDTDGDGKPDPVAGAIVKIVKDFDGDGIIDFSAEAVTGPDGSYTIAIPRGEEDYTVSITKTMTLGDQSKTITIEQPARAGTVTGAGGEVFASKKTISGVINSMKSSGGILLAPPVASNLKVYLKDSQGNYVLDESTRQPKGFTVGPDGVFTATNLTQGEYSLEVRFLNTDGQEIIVNQRDDGSLPKVGVTIDGQLNIQEELIDPYGTITDSKSGSVIEGAHVILYYADTQRNRDKGITPDTQVVLPILTGFAPNDNINPQDSDSYGNYAYMVFAYTDYYLVASKSGYDTYVSPTISVETAIVRHDFSMVKQGGVTITPPVTPPVTTPAPEPTEASTNVSIEQSVYPEQAEVPVTVTYNVESGSTAGGTVKLELPEGVQVIDLDGGKLEGNAIVWPADSKNGEFHPVLKLPDIDGKERKIELVSSYVTGKGEAKGAASVILNIVAGEHEHIRYIQGYPDGKFQPNRSLTRAELAAIMARLIGKYDGADPGYTDVDSGFWAYGYIKAVTEAGLFTGYEGNRFLPNQPVSRAELAVVMVRYLGLKAGTPVQVHFSDIQNHWAIASIEALYRNSMISGYENGTYKPSSSIKRVEAVTLINHMLFRGPLHDIEPTFPDVPANYWGFGHIEEASVSHASTYDEQGEEHFIEEIEDQVK